MIHYSSVKFLVLFHQKDIDISADTTVMSGRAW